MLTTHQNTIFILILICNFYCTHSNTSDNLDYFTALNIKVMMKIITEEDQDFRMN